MGRGRQKAKHTKVARDLKYFSPDTNYTALERELMLASAQNDQYVDKWADDADDEDDVEPVGNSHSAYDEPVKDEADRFEADRFEASDQAVPAEDLSEPQSKSA